MSAHDEVGLKTDGCVAIFSPGVWRLKREVATMTGLTPVRSYFGYFHRPSIAAIAGWGYKATANRARRMAAARTCPYFALEDGFLRSVRPGPGTPSLSYVLDRTGIYYDARGPSDLETFIRENDFSTDELKRAEALIGRLRRDRLSKYNGGPPFTRPASWNRGSDLVVVVDQTMGDASISGALATSADFQAMLETALAENPGAIIAVKAHPEVIAGRKQGFLLEQARKRGLPVIADQDVWSLLEETACIYTVSSLFGFEALLAGVKVVCFGVPFYAGWGLTDDRKSLQISYLNGRRGTVRALSSLVAGAYLRYTHYFDPWFREKISAEEAVDILLSMRRSYRALAKPVVTAQLSPWKRHILKPYLTGMAGPPIHKRDFVSAQSFARQCDGDVYVWGSVPTEEREPFVRMEDGFIRSVGLGLLGETPSSIVLDAQGLYFDSRSPSAFESLAEHFKPDPELLARAAHLRAAIVAAHISKYNVGTREPLPGKEVEGRIKILVPGQVEDDASLLYGSPSVRKNGVLLERVRARHPEAFILYKPHPDVETGLRPGAVPPFILKTCADAIIRKAPITDCLAWADRVETITSLTGFEALLREKAVTVHGQPFYAGWGLTEDLFPIARRTNRLSLDALVAVALILYPLYVDPLTRLPATPEAIIRRLTELRDTPPPLPQRLFRLSRQAFAYLLYAATAKRKGG